MNNENNNFNIETIIPTFVRVAFINNIFDSQIKYFTHLFSSQNNEHNKFTTEFYLYVLDCLKHETIQKVQNKYTKIKSIVNNIFYCKNIKISNIMFDNSSFFYKNISSLYQIVNNISKIYPGQYELSFSISLQNNESLSHITNQNLTKYNFCSKFIDLMLGNIHISILYKLLILLFRFKIFGKPILFDDKIYKYFYDKYHDDYKYCFVGQNININLSLNYYMNTNSRITSNNKNINEGVASYLSESILINKKTSINIIDVNFDVVELINLTQSIFNKQNVYMYVFEKLNQANYENISESYIVNKLNQCKELSENKLNQMHLKDYVINNKKCNMFRFIK